MDKEIIKLLSNADNGKSYDELQTELECDSGDLSEALYGLKVAGKIYSREHRKENGVENITRYFCEQAHRIIEEKSPPKK
jgi:hypothetical protein